MLFVIQTRQIYMNIDNVSLTWIINCSIIGFLIPTTDGLVQYSPIAIK